MQTLAFLGANFSPEFFSETVCLEISKWPTSK